MPPLLVFVCRDWAGPPALTAGYAGPSNVMPSHSRLLAQGASSLMLSARFVRRALRAAKVFCGSWVWKHARHRQL
eukprot:147327-Rhodomonas_salina.1